MIEVKWTIFIAAIILILVYAFIVTYTLINLDDINVEGSVKLIIIFTISAIYLYATYIYFTVKYPLLMV